MEISYTCKVKGYVEKRSITIEDELSKGSSPTEILKETALKYKDKTEGGVLIDLYRYLRFSHGAQDRKLEIIRKARNQTLEDYYNGTEFKSTFSEVLPIIRTENPSK